MITFGICLGPDRTYLNRAVESIHNNVVDEYEIIIIGQDIPDIYFGAYGPKVKGIEFDESQKNKWITRKKNILMDEASIKSTHVVLMHDYYSLISHARLRIDSMPLKSIYEIQDDQNIKNIFVPRVVNADGSIGACNLINQRYTRAFLKAHPEHIPTLMNIAPRENGPEWVCRFNPKDFNGHYMNILYQLSYASGGIWIQNRNAPIRQNEDYVWGQAEDIEFSERAVREGYRIIPMKYTEFRILKPGKWQTHQMPSDMVRELCDFVMENGGPA